MNRREAIGAGITALISCFVPKSTKGQVSKTIKKSPEIMGHAKDEFTLPNKRIDNLEAFHFRNEQLMQSFKNFQVHMERLSKKAKETGQAMQTFGSHVASLQTADLDMEEIYELGRREPYHRYVNFPVEVTEPIVTPVNLEDQPYTKKLLELMKEVMRRNGGVLCLGLLK